MEELLPVKYVTVNTNSQKKRYNNNNNNNNIYLKSNIQCT